MRELPVTSRTDRPATRSGLGMLMITVYGIFALASTARAAYQISTKLDEAPVAFLLSGFAALLYVVATIALVRATPRSRAIAWTSVTIEFVGVLSVGLVSFLRPELFPEATVWSHLGEGYGYVPLLLPVAGLWWLARTREAAASPDTALTDPPA
ncbi:hypothetical protein ACTVCO_10055 [Sanguibacter sp. A247]|uniref:hypothetical protein n=1 Tax=unclassified Sanguibacter TaxID=2645534 RepID=UPI003FD7A5B8